MAHEPLIDGLPSVSLSIDITSETERFKCFCVDTEVVSKPFTLKLYNSGYSMSREDLEELNNLITEVLNT
jgi:hypothetical protein